MTTETKIIGGATLLTILAFIGFIVFTTKNQLPEVKADQATLVAKDSPKIWNDAAEVTIVEFADFQCPACAAAQPIIRRVISDYDGKVNLVFRHFPLSQHRNALPAANLAEAAGKEGKFWEMYDLLYEKQAEWEKLADPRGAFLSYAASLKLNTDTVEEVLDGNTYIDKIQSDIAAGQQLGVNSTPTFFINGEKLIGVPSYDVLKNKIDSYLGK